MKGTYAYHHRRALALLADVYRMPRSAIELRRLLIGTARVHIAAARAAAAREAAGAVDLRMTSSV